MTKIVTQLRISVGAVYDRALLSNGKRARSQTAPTETQHDFTYQLVRKAQEFVV